MRVLASILFCASGLAAVAQPAWSPLSRVVERPFATALHRFGSDAHTAVRPYRMDDRRKVAGADSLLPTAALPTLDKWAGVRNGRKFRFGPLAEATAGWDAKASEALIQRYGGGAWTDVDLGPKLNLHLDGMAWQERFPRYLDSLVMATQVAPGEGYAQGNGPEKSHFDWNGHLSWDPGKYFNFTLGKGRNFLGEGHRSLLLSDEAYSYPYLRITTTFWHVKYVNLFAQMSDIRGAGGDPTEFQKKYTSMHYLSWNVSKRVNVALFEAIVWSSGDDQYPRGFDVQYLNPVIFYRPVEFSIGSPDNALLGGALNVKAGRNTQCYLQFMFDEFLLDQVRSGNGWYANKQSFQLGVMARDAFQVKGLDVRAEWNVVRPFMYTHSDTRQNYAHFGQPLAHPYGSNLQEVLLHADRQLGRWNYGLRTSLAWMGEDTEDSFGNNIFRPESERPKEDGQFISYGYRIGMQGPYTLFHGELRAGYLLDPSTGTRLEASALLRQRSSSLVPAVQDAIFRLGLVCHFRERYPEQEVRYRLP